MCSGSEAGSYLRLIDLVYHSTLGLRVIKKKVSDHADDEGGLGLVADRVATEPQVLAHLRHDVQVVLRRLDPLPAAGGGVNWRRRETAVEGRGGGFSVRLLACYVSAPSDPKLILATA